MNRTFCVLNIIKFSNKNKLGTFDICEVDEVNRTLFLVSADSGEIGTINLSDLTWGDFNSQINLEEPGRRTQWLVNKCQYELTTEVSRSLKRYTDTLRIFYKDPINGLCARPHDLGITKGALVDSIQLSSITFGIRQLSVNAINDYTFVKYPIKTTCIDSK